VSSARPLTTTSYAFLGLLAVQPWTTYELTRQIDRSVGRIWPRTTSKLYEEPKKLVDHRLARAKHEHVGQRPRTVYSISAKGRRALAAWQAEPGAGPVLEFEALVKLLFAEHGSKDDALATVASVRAWAAERNTGNLAAARAYRVGDGGFQARAAQSMLVGGFLTDFYAMVARWADWATTAIDGWPDKVSDAVADPASLADIVRRADW
jgi:PadR family transcriptional regulator AphA